MNIRPYNKKDFRYVQDICMATSDYANDDTPFNRAFLCAMYCDYYLDNQSEFCFVAADGDDVPVGYVLCAADCADYTEKMSDLYLPFVRKINSGEYYKFNAMIKVAEKYARQGYTAHLHIDILEGYQQQGVGTELIHTLFGKLKEMNVEGVYLICGLKNESARAFYESCGFDDIDYLSGAVVYGKKFFEE
ncbi:MAG: GNAT family N-acetyltransferase [Corallococcus sp.]|nr:GNAT family N-acetyltransferase [Bacillota bacterium]MCM1533835.1 GNAT family N-acetyltransferase [Corallococcus sp.]